MADISKDLEEWFKTRPSWLQDATRRLLGKGELQDADYDELLRICGNEKGVKFEEEIPKAVGIPAGAFAQEEHAHKIELTSISDIVGINALKPSKPLKISGSLSVIYGQNGTGKSGYTRLLKQVCGAKNLGPLHSNTCEDRPAGQSCQIKYLYDGTATDLAWSTGLGINEQLASVEIYDSACGSVYVNEENQLAYEPALLRLFTQLTNTCDHLSRRLNDLSDGMVSAKPQLPKEHNNTKSGEWYRSLTSTTSSETIDKACAWSDKEQKTLDSLNARLKIPYAAAEAAVVRKKKKAVEQLIEIFRNWQIKLEGESPASYLAAKKDCSVKREAASNYAKSVFKKSPLSGIGEEAWNLLWEQARAYSQKVAYPDVQFPNTANDSVCVLCQQPLNDEAKSRLSEFEEFVKGELESAAKTAKNTLDGLEAVLKKTLDEEVISSFVAAAGLDEEISKKLYSLREKIEQESHKLLSTEIDNEFKSELEFGVVDELAALSENMETSIMQLDEDAKEDKREEIKKETAEQEARKWLSQQKEAISAEVFLLGEKAKIAQAKVLTNTKTLTIKKALLSDVLVTAEYIKRFEEEVIRFGAGRIKVKLEKTRSGKGRVFFKIKLENNHLGLAVDEILSEGEFRIISLAAFVADVESHNDKSSFIFDDPISSLDQGYEENVCTRLVQMANDRQVIVFTHRLSMLSLLENASKKNGVTFNIVGLRREPWGAGEPSDTPIFAQKTLSALNALLDRTAIAKKTFENNGWDNYEMSGKGIASQFRIVLEKIVEKDLLADVVSRFRREVNTKNKLEKISKITDGDCRLVDDYMTKYSKHEHSQSDEMPVPLPEPDELKQDIEAVKTWLEEFNKR